MTATAIREGARIAALILVLTLAAVLGLVVGNALQSRSSIGIGAPAPDAAADRGTPSFADPNYQLIRRAALADDRHLLRRRAPADQIGAGDNEARPTAPAPR